MNGLDQYIQLDAQAADLARTELANLSALLPKIDSLEACGADCRARRAKAEAIKRQLEAVLQHFGPK